MADGNGTEEMDTFTGINPEDLSPEMQTVYKSMQGDYTRKTQELAEKRKVHDAKLGEWDEMQRKFGSDQKELEQWRAWYKQLEEEAVVEDGSDTNLSLNDAGGGADDQRVIDPAAQSSKMVESMQKRIDSLEGEVRSTNQALQTSTQQVRKMFDYQSQLNKLADDHTGLDRAALLKHAVDGQYTDLEKAYQDLYREDIIKAEVDVRLAAELEKQRTVGVHGQPVQHIVRTAEEGSPKNFEEATESIMQKKAQDGTLD